jgi:lipopolysaccharide transport system permease protein
MTSLSHTPECSNVVDITHRIPVFPDLREAWRRRGLSLMLIQRNLKLRYAQTFLGAVWLVIQPLLLTGILSLVLGSMLSLPTDGSPYFLFVFSGTVLWSFFQRIVNDTSTSMVASAGLISKVYFPRILVPVSGALTATVDVLPAYCLLLLSAALYGKLAAWQILLSPIVLLLVLLAALAVGLWVTMIDAIYRDVRMAIPAALQLGFFVTPVMYSESVIPKRWEVVYNLNPLVGYLRAFRWLVLADVPPPTLLQFGWCVGLTVILLIGGLVAFTRLEQLAVDRI